jgi:hypothetical protein
MIEYFIIGCVWTLIYITAIICARSDFKIVYIIAAFLFWPLDLLWLIVGFIWWLFSFRSKEF